MGDINMAAVTSHENTQKRCITLMQPRSQGFSPSYVISAEKSPGNEIAPDDDKQYLSTAWYTTLYATS